jgi:HTH-type transcriptional repressor of NAD biosynthesis genes
MTTALMLGKFLPPHAGHTYLAETARQHAEEVIVCLLAHPEEPIPVEVRHAWLEEILPWATVRSGVATHPIDYDDPAVYDLWAATIKDVIERDGVDILLTSEPAYGDKTAVRLGARHLLVDPDRTAVPVSGTAIRADPFANWRYLAPCVRAWYVKRVSLLGAESTGTTTLAERLAREFDTVSNPEYGREYGAPKDARGEPWTSEEFVHIAHVQQAREDAAARVANRILFCDTDVLATALWHEHYMGYRSAEVEALAWSRRYDLTFVTAADIPWEDDGTRNSDAQRQRMQRRFEELLAFRPEPVIEVRGSVEERTRTAILAIERVLGLRPPQPSVVASRTSLSGASVSGPGSE